MDDMLITVKNKTHIQKLKAPLKKEFDMKDLGVVKKILGIEITRDRGSGRLRLFQKNYVIKVWERFNMAEVRPVTTPLVGHFKLSSKQCPQQPEEKKKISRIPYASTVGSLMYAMVCTRSDLAYAVSIVSRFLSNSEK